MEPPCGEIGGIDLANQPGASNSVWREKYDAIYWNQRPLSDVDQEWQCDDSVWAAERLNEVVSGLPPDPVDNASSEPARSDNHMPQSIPQWHTHLGHNLADPDPRQLSSINHPPARRRRPIFSWFAFTFGFMIFVCGAGLLIGGYFMGRAELWNLGIPVVMVGQIGLLIGLVWLLEGLWQSHHTNANTLGALDDRLKDLKQTTAMMGTTHSSAAQSFYAHMADGASPQLMLADLKGQLDMLAMKLAKERE